MQAIIDATAYGLGGVKCQNIAEMFTLKRDVAMTQQWLWGISLAKSMTLYWMGFGAISSSWCEGSFTPCATRGEATSHLLEGRRLGLYTTSNLARCHSRLTYWNTDNSGVKSQKHEKSHRWVVRKHVSSRGVVPDRARSCGQMILGPICWRSEAASRSGVNAPVGFPSTQSIAYDASRRLTSSCVWCKLPFIKWVKEYVLWKTAFISVVTHISITLYAFFHVTTLRFFVSLKYI